MANAKSLAELEPEKDIPKEEPRGQAPTSWPDKGVIEFKEVVMPYNPGGSPVLKGVNFAFRYYIQTWFSESTARMYKQTVTE